MSYHSFRDENGDDCYGSFEVFYHAAGDEMRDEEGGSMRPGYYWWACFPGCLPDGDPCGPFDTEDEAFDDAINYGGD